MIEVKIKRNDDLITFLCPECRYDDVSYISMPKECYRCNFVYNFSMPEMVKIRKERERYHFGERNSKKTGCANDTVQNSIS